MLKCLAFIPLEKVMEKFVWIKNCFSSADFDGFLKYVEKTWVGHNPYPPSLWNIHEHLSKYEDDFIKRSNLACESFNSDLIRRLKRAHPNLFTLLNVLAHIEQGKMREYK